MMIPFPPIRPFAHLIIALALPFHSIGQDLYSIQWQRCIGGSGYDSPYDIHQTPDGGYILAGRTSSTDGDATGNHGYIDAWVVKLDANGEVEWNRCLGGTGGDELQAVAITAGGGCIVAGYHSSDDGDPSEHHGAGDLWVVKLSTDGVIEWERSYGGSQTDAALDIQQTTDGGYIVVGRTVSWDGDAPASCLDQFNSNTLWVLKLDAMGEIAWQQCLGGNGDDVACSIIQTDDEGYVLVANTDSDDGDVVGHHGSYDAWAVRLDAAGNVEWTKALGGSLEDGASAIITAPEGGYLVVGTASSGDGDVPPGNGSHDVWLTELTATGELSWSSVHGGPAFERGRRIHTIGSAITGIRYVVSASAAANGGDVTGHQGGEDIWLVTVGPVGELLVQQCFGGSDSEGLTVSDRTSDGYFILAATTYSNDGDVSGNHGDGDAWVVKLGAEPSTGSPSDPEPDLHVNLDPTGSHLLVTRNDPRTDHGARAGLYDIRGSLRAERPMVDGRCTFDLASVPKGVLIVTVNGNEGRSVQRVVIP